MSNVENIKERLSVVDVVGSYVTLQKAGKNYKAQCPFHNEKTPSFSVSSDRGFYYCFGCGAKGDMFTFVQEFEGLDFKGALRVLADKAGVVLEQEDPKARDEREKLASILEQAVLFFESGLTKNKSAEAYLIKRGLQKETIKSWCIGYAPEGWRNLYEFFIQKNNDAGLLLKAGLIKVKESGGYYDVFRGRIIFPIFDTAGRAVGFSGRQFEPHDGTPKYLNTPETILFDKSRLLYGLDRAKSAIRSKDYSIVVEGQFDLIMSHQAGFDNTVATSGTSVTKDHLERLKKISSNIILCFDSDEAGVKATFRTALLATDIGMEVKIGQLPFENDPADLILKDKALYTQIIKEAPFAVLFFLDYAMNKDSDTRKQMKYIRQYVFPLLSFITSGMEKDRLASLVAERLSVNKQAVLDDAAQVKVELESGVNSEEVIPQITEERRVGRTPERNLVGIILWQEASSKPVCDIHVVREKFKQLVGEEYAAKLFARGEEIKNELIFESEQEHGELISAEYIDDLIFGVEERYVGRHLDALKKQIQKAEEERNEEKVEELMKEFYQLLRKQEKVRENRSGFTAS